LRFCAIARHFSKAVAISFLTARKSHCRIYDCIGSHFVNYCKMPVPFALFAMTLIYLMFSTKCNFEFCIVILIFTF